MKKKKRLDQMLLDGKHVGTLREAESLIRSGRVYISDLIADKPGILYPVDSPLRVKNPPPFVSRGGTKLQGALKYFNIDPTGWVCADIGASSGGFTDCLLQNGASLVYAIDVAYGQLDWKLRTDSKVIVHERLNIRNVSSQHIQHQLDLAVFDTSFISLKKVIPPVLPFFGPTVRILALIKPQFELAKSKVDKGGVVKNEYLRQEAIELIKNFGEENNLLTKGIFASSIKGPKGNQEYLIHLTRSEREEL